jgi:hypothetical protein
MKQFWKNVFFICGIIGFITPIIFMNNKGVGIVVGFACCSGCFIGLYLVDIYCNNDSDNNDNE